MVNLLKVQNSQSSMIRGLSLRFSKSLIFFSVLLALLLFGLGQDFLHSRLRNYSFQFSESLLFNSFWILFIPLAIAQIRLLKRSTKKLNWLKIALSAVISSGTHLVLFALIVFTISAQFFSHTYGFERMFFYGLSEYLYICLIGYSLLGLIGFRSMEKPDQTEADLQLKESHFIQTLSVGNGIQKTILNVDEIVSIVAESPYIKLVSSKGTYLHTDTLKSISEKLNPKAFVRIHKSTIVNLNKMISYKSRLNGDFDVQLSDNSIARISRNYAKSFKAHYNNSSS